MRERLIALVLVACATSFAGGAASAAQKVDNARTVTGSIVGIDRASRTITVVEQLTGAKYRVTIPRGQRVAILPTVSFGSAVEFERLIIGLQYRGVSGQ